MLEPTASVIPHEPPPVKLARGETPAEVVKRWSRSVLKKKIAIDKQMPIALTDMQRLADLAMYDGLIMLHGIMELPNTEELVRVNEDGTTGKVTVSNVPYKVSAANGVTAVQRYLLERSKSEKDNSDVGTTIIFEDSQQITSPDGSKVVTAKKQTVKRHHVEQVDDIDMDDYQNDLDGDAAPEEVDFTDDNDDDEDIE